MTNCAKMNTQMCENAHLCVFLLRGANQLGYHSVCKMIPFLKNMNFLEILE